MSSQPSVQNTATVVSPAPAATSLMRRHRLAKSKLDLAFEKQSSVALMIGPDSFELSRVIAAFIGGLDERTTSVRLRQPQENALAALGEINRVIGFDPKDLSLSDLQNVLTLFLEYQSKHGHRTVLCVEKADQQSMWLLDCVARLIKSNESSQMGRSLMIILSGANRLTDVVRNPVFDFMRRKAGKPISLAPMSIFETREFLRQMSDSAGLRDIQSMFEFDAVDRLHSISGGVPSNIARLFRECVAIVDRNGGHSATSKVVVKAARNLRTAFAGDPENSRPRPALVPQSVETGRRLLIRCPKQAPREYSLKPGRFMLGRTTTADICLPSPSVSRRHALLIDTGKSAQLLDLGSANGTLAGTERIREVTLSPGAVLTLGDCQIEYAVG